MQIIKLVVLLLLAWTAAAPAQGVIVPDCRGCTRPVPLPNALPVELVQIDTRIVAKVATTHVTQVFRNETDLTLEGTYFFPIPEQASVSEFVLWDGDRRLVGEVRSREEARRIYDSIVRRRRDPGLLEYAGPNLFQASIFPILPRSTKKLELTYTEVLRAENGTVGYRYPLGTGRNLAPVERVAGRIIIQTDRGLGTVYSPSHEVEVNRSGRRSASVSFESTRRSEPRDVQLFFTPSEREVGLTLLTHREPGRDGYFLLILSPTDERLEREYAAKDILFVLDTSGSMADEGKMDKAQRALLFGIRGLRPADRFNVVSFAGDAHLMETGLVRADAAGIRQGVRFVEGLRATGGTNINEALLTAVRQFDRRGERPRMVVFLTDGLPTVGQTQPEQILAAVREARPADVRLFTFGVGYDVNTRLLDKLAAEGRGTADYVEPKEDLEVRVSSFFSKVNHPVLTDLALDLGAVRADQMYPRALPDLFRGTEVALMGRYRNERDLRNVAVRLTGRASPPRTFSYNGLDFPLRNRDNDFLPRLWATRRVGWLMEQIRANGENRELRDEIVDLGTRYGIVTPYTSYLALEPGARDALQLEGLVVTGAGGEAPRGGRPQGRSSPLGQTPPPASPVAPVPTAPPPPRRFQDLSAPRAASGEAAVQWSKAARERQESLQLEADAPAAMRRVEGKTFYLRDGIWTDAEWKPEAKLPEMAVEFGSSAYFDLLKQQPDLAKFFALGEQVIVVREGRVYRVRATQ